MKFKYIILTLFLLLFINGQYIFAQGHWILNKSDDPAPGYIKFNTSAIKHFSLWDNYGLQQYITTPYPQLKLIYYRLLKNGYWIAMGNPGPSKYKYYLLDQDLNLADSIPLSSKYKVDIHDVELLANGNYLVLYTTPIYVDMSKLIDGGFHTARVTTSVIVETDIEGNTIWEWKSADHLNILDATKDINLTEISIDFPHANSFCEDKDGNIIVSFRHLDEIAKINRSTGEFVWRMGGSSSKNNQFTFVNDEDENGFTGFSHQHSVSILDNGNLLMYDNGNMKPIRYSRAVEYKLDIAGKTATRIWDYRANPDIYVSSMGSTFRLPNGNTLINWGSNRIFEVNHNKEIAYDLQYIPEDNREIAIYRAYKYITKMDAVTQTVNTAGDFLFQNETFNTNIGLNISSITGSGDIVIQKHYYSPPEAEYSDSGFVALLPLRWGISQSDNISEVSGNITFSLGNIPESVIHKKFGIFKRDKEAKGVFNLVQSTFNPSNRILEANYAGTGEYVVAYFDIGIPSVKYPVDGDTVIGVSGFIKWDAIPGAGKYRYQLSQTNDFKQVILDSATESLSGYYGILNYSTQYYCRLKAFSKADTSEWSQVISFTTEAMPLVQLLQPEDGYPEYRKSDSLTWAGIAGISDYWLQISTEPTFKSRVLSVQVQGTIYKAQDLTPFTKYFWRVKGFSDASTGDWSETRSFTTGLLPPALISPGDNSIDVPRNGMLIWKNIPGISFYQVLLSDDKEFNQTLAGSDKLTDTLFEYKELRPIMSYYWKVRSVLDADTSEWSDAFQFSTKGDYTLHQPILLSPSDSTIASPVTGILYWQAVEGADTYLTEISDDYAFESVVLSNDEINDTLFNYGSLDYNRMYFWRVTAFNDSASSPNSEVWAFTTRLEPPKAVNPPDSSKNQPETGNIMWTSSSAAVSYILEISEDFEFNTIIIQDTIEDDTTYNYKLKPLAEYFWRVKALNNENYSRWSNTSSFSIGPPTDIPELYKYYRDYVYPNPARDNLYIQLSECVNSLYSIYSINGMQVAKGYTEGCKVNISFLSPGYFILKSQDRFYYFVKYQ